MNLPTNQKRAIAKFTTNITKFHAASVKLRSGLDMAHSDLLVMAGKCASAVMMVENVWINVPPDKHDGCIAADTPLIHQPATTTGSSCLLSMLLVMVTMGVRLYPVILGAVPLSP
jgi:hypothetical protein